jgi:hypothetical protein
MMCSTRRLIPPSVRPWTAVLLICQLPRGGLERFHISPTSHRRPTNHVDAAGLEGVIAAATVILTWTGRHRALATDSLIKGGLERLTYPPLVTVAPLTMSMFTLCAVNDSLIKIGSAYC